MSDEESASDQPKAEQGHPEPEPADATPSVEGLRQPAGADSGEPTAQVVATPPGEPPPPPVVSPEPGVPQYDWSQPPGPGAAQPGPARPPDAMDHLIPSKNPPALIGYYLGCFSVIPCFTPFLGPAALVYGIKGLRAARSNPNLPGAGHAITAIVLGALTTGLLVIGIVFVAVAAVTGNM